MNPQQAEMPFYESAEDATHSAILRSRIPPKEIAHALFPDLKMDSAYARLMGSIKHSRPEKLTADQHIFIANYCQEYDFLYYCAQNCHHSQPVSVEPEDELVRQEREFIESVKRLEKLAVEIGESKERARLHVAGGRSS